ncbi:MAG: dephospho-CoA kinase [Oscillospiraceae bacterium]|nr:dephospho-CoA kinase [Oscillospiraceae bacterium]
MYIIGITGGTGAGKSSAIKALQKLGANALDCDAIYHDILLNNTKMKEEIKAQFHDVTTDGEIDRKKLGEIVWNNPDSLKRLNSITHKYMNEEINSRITSFKENNTALTAIDAIALIESGQGKKCNTIVGIIAPQEKRLTRIMQRDSISEENALKRINAQQFEVFFRENCDYILENIYETETEFEKKCTEFFKELIP